MLDAEMGGNGEELGIKQGRLDLSRELLVERPNPLVQGTFQPAAGHQDVQPRDQPVAQMPWNPAPPFSSRFCRSPRPFIPEKSRRQHNGDRFTRQRPAVGQQRQAVQPQPCTLSTPADVGQQSDQKEQRGQGFGPTADVIHHLRVHRMQGEEQPAQSRRKRESSN